MATLAPAPPNVGNNAGSYTKGQCTYGAATLAGWIPAGLGNADTWLTRAAADGFSTSSAPQVGDVVVYQQGTSGPTADSPGAAYYSLGHVAVVTGLGPNNTFTVQEMNYGNGNRVGLWDTRVSSLQNVLGFIQPPGSTPGPAVGSGYSTTTSTSPCAWSVPLLGCVMSESALQKFYGVLLIAGGGLILTVGLGLVVLGALAETKLGKTVSRTAGPMGLGAIAGAAAAPGRAMGARRSGRAAAATTEASRQSADAHQQALRRAQLRTARARARRSEEGVRTQRAVTQGRQDSGDIAAFERTEGKSRRRAAVESRRAGAAVERRQRSSAAASKSAGSADERRRHRAALRDQRYQDVFGERP